MATLSIYLPNFQLAKLSLTATQAQPIRGGHTLCPSSFGTALVESLSHTSRNTCLQRNDLGEPMG